MTIRESMPKTSAGASAQAVWRTRFRSIRYSRLSTVVIVNHGNYYTVYGNIASPSVKVGDVVNRGQAVGKLAPSEDDPLILPYISRSGKTATSSTPSTGSDNLLRHHDNHLKIYP